MDNLQIPSGPSSQLKCEVVLFLPELLTSSALTDTNSSSFPIVAGRMGSGGCAAPGWQAEWEEEGWVQETSPHTAHQRLPFNNSEFSRPISGHCLPLPCSGKCDAQDGWPHIGLPFVTCSSWGDLELPRPLPWRVGNSAPEEAA